MDYCRVRRCRPPASRATRSNVRSYLHHMMFSHLYVWAGRPRTVAIAKGGTPFCPPQNIDAMMGALFAELERERWLAGLETEPFIERAAYYVCEFNAVHPFREGNGRAIPTWVY